MSDQQRCQRCQDQGWTGWCGICHPLPEHPEPAKSFPEKLAAPNPGQDNLVVPDSVIEEAAATAIDPLAEQRIIPSRKDLQLAVELAAPPIATWAREQGRAEGAAAERERIKRDLYALPTHDTPQTDDSVDIDALLEGSVDPAGRSIDQRIEDAEARGAAAEKARWEARIEKLAAHYEQVQSSEGALAASVLRSLLTKEEATNEPA